MLTTNPSHVFILASGGFDSTAAILYFGIRGYFVHPVHFTYDSHQMTREKEALEKVRSHLYLYNICPVIEVELPIVNHSTLSTESDSSKIESGSYADQQDVSTFVPGRNLIFLSHIANIAESYKLDNPDHEVFISCGVHNSDWEQYPDTRPAFIEHIASGLYHGTDGRIRLLTPFLRVTKSGILSVVFNSDEIKISVQARMALEASYSCYRGGERHCGTCPTCLERHYAFLDSFGFDLTDYQQKPKERKPTRLAPAPTNHVPGISEFCSPTGADVVLRK